MSAKPSVEISVSGVRSAIDFDGRPLVIVRYRGRPALPAQQVGEILGYAEQGKTLAKVIRKDWSAEFQVGVHMDVLRGPDLAEYKRDADDAEGKLVSASTRALTVLYPAGVELLARKTGKPVGQRLASILGGAPVPTPTATPVPVVNVTAVKRPAASAPPWWWADAHKYIERCVAAGMLTEGEALLKLAPLYEEAIGLR